MLKTFDQPLSSEEEIQYIQMLADVNRQKEAKEILILKNLRLVAHIAKKYQNVEEDMEDLISLGTIGLIKAIDTYRPEKGIRLATYAARCIENELLMMLRNRKKLSREMSIYEPIGTDKEGNTISLLDVIEAEQPELEEQMEVGSRIKKMLELIGKVLDEREKEILILRYGLYNGKEITQREVGKKLGISRSYVSRIEKKALRKLRSSLLENK